LVKAHTKLPVLAAYPYLAVGYRNFVDTDMRLVAYWQFNMGLNQGESDREERCTGAGDGGHLTGAT